MGDGIMKEKIPVLYTCRLRLGPIRQQDEATMLDIFLNGDVRKTYMIPEFDSREAALPLFHRFRSLSADGSHTVYGIFLRDQLIGFLNDVCREQDSIEMGYVIHPDFWNHGYATEAFSLVTQTLFARGYTLVKAGAFAENTASMRVMEKCGMTPTGAEEEISYGGILRRCICYELRSDSPAAKAQAIRRVQWMEQCFDLLQTTVDISVSAQGAPWFQSLLRIVTHYYEDGLWLWDYERDAQGYFPQDLKRGILSQDGFYNFLTDLR